VKKPFYGWWVVFASFVIAFYVGGTVTYGFTAFFKPIEDEFRWSYAKISAAASLRGFEMGIFGPLMGFLVDHFGSRKLVFFGVFTIGLGLILVSLTKSLPMFYGSFTLIALGTSGCTSTVLITAVASWFRRNVGKALGITMCGFGASGLLISPIVQLIDICGWRTTSFVLGFGIWVLGIPLSFIIRRSSEQYSNLHDVEILGELPPNREIQDLGIGWKEVLKTRGFWQISIAEVIRVMAMMAVITHIMPYLESEGISRSDASLIATGVPLFSIIGRFGFGCLGDTFDKRYVMAGTYFLTGVGLLLFSFCRVTWPIFPFLLFFPSGYGGGITLRGAILREYYGRNSLGRILGIMMGIVSIGAIIGPSIAGWVFDTFGSYHPIWLVFAVVIGIPIIQVATIRRLP